MEINNYLTTARDARSAAVWIELNLDPIANEDLNAMQTHFTGKIRKYRLSRIKLNAKKCVRERFVHDSFYNLWFSHICAAKNSKKPL